jgi:hypothetical protein
LGGPGCHARTFIDRSPAKPGLDQGPTTPDFAGPSQMSPDIKSAPKYGN